MLTVTDLFCGAEPRIGSLCSGAGMLDEAVRSVIGGSVAWHCEYEPPTEKQPKPRQAAARVLAYRYPGVPNHGDLTRVDWTQVEPIDVATAGYPCQPDSLAGKGLSLDDDRWIWEHIADALRLLRPRLCVFENVAGHVGRGFRTVLGSLASLGFDAEWTMLRASDVGAAHGRDRIFILAWLAEHPFPFGRAGWASDARRGAVDGTAAAGPGGEPAPNAHRSTRSQRRFAAPGQAESRRSWTDAGGSGRASAPYPDGDPLRQQPVGQRRCHDEAVAHLARAGTAPDSASDGRDERRAEPARQLRRPDATERSATTTHAEDEQPGQPQGDDPAALVGTAARAGDRDHAGRTATRVRDLGRGARPQQAPADANSEGRSPERRRDAVRCDADRRDSADIAWGDYEPAIRRWERLTRPAPSPVETAPKGGRRLSCRFDEWLMGWPDGWVTDVPGVTHNDALHLCGNGVVPQQAAEGVRRLLRAVAASMDGAA